MIFIHQIIYVFYSNDIFKEILWICTGSEMGGKNKIIIESIYI